MSLQHGTENLWLRCGLESELPFSEVRQARLLFVALLSLCSLQRESDRLCAHCWCTDHEHHVWCTAACTFHAQPNLGLLILHPPGDEGGESELLGEDLPLEPSVARAERSHLIVWQVMYGSEWAHGTQVETGMPSLLHGSFPSSLFNALFVKKESPHTVWAFPPVNFTL